MQQDHPIYFTASSIPAVGQIVWNYLLRPQQYDSGRNDYKQTEQ
ncbi:MAG: hypothetical protein A07HR60_00955 [uncultured archaeon A07HR60]|jgi:hypothetical protein|nr:MAG: hypothetical protein A07HR60_00955 [uncultured archaeon A07HR60]